MMFLHCLCVRPLVSVTVSGITPKDEMRDWNTILWVVWLCAK